MKKGIIDRFEGDYVIVEMGSEHEQFERKHFPLEAKEGDVVLIDKGTIRIDTLETAERKASIKQLMDKLFK